MLPKLVRELQLIQQHTTGSNDMQGIQQDVSSLLAGLMSQQGASTGLGGILQGVDLQGENTPREFLSTLQTSLQGLIDSGQLSLSGPEGEQTLSALQQLLGQDLALGGQGLPLATEAALPHVTLPAEMLEEGSQGVLLETAEAGMAADENLVVSVMNQLSPTLVEHGESLVVDEEAAISPLPLLTPSSATAQDARRVHERLNQVASAVALGKSPVAVPASSIIGLTNQALPLQPLADSGAQELTERPVVSSAPVVNTPIANMMMENQKSFANIRQQAGSELLVDIDDADPANLPGQGLAANARAVTSPASTDAKPVSQSFINLPVTDPRWQGELNNRVAVMARAAVSNGAPQVAEIRLNPANMGPIEIRVQVNDDQQTSVAFVAQHAATREVIESSIPRLREMFNGSGLMLADADVSDQAPSYSQQHAEEQGGDGEHFSQAPAALDMDVSEELAAAGMTAADLSPVRGLDLFA